MTDIEIVNPNFSSVVSRLIIEAQSADILWQAGGGLIALVLSGLLAYWLKLRIQGSSSREQVGTTSHLWILNTVWPFLTAFFMWLAQEYLISKGLNVSFLSLGIVMTVTWGLINGVLFALRRTFPSANLAGSGRAFAFIVWIMAALHVFGLLHELSIRLEAISIPVGSGRLTLLGLIYALLLVLATMLVALWLGALIDNRIMHMTKVDLSLRVVLSRLIRSLLLVFSILLAMSTAGIDLTILSVFGGALGVGLGLGFQRIASNYVSGFILLFERSVKIGDIITPAGQLPGWVTAIRTRFTVVRGFDGVETMVPNETLITSLVQTQASTTSPEMIKRLDRKSSNTVSVLITHDSSVEKAMEIMIAEALKHDRVLKDAPAPKALLMNFTPDGLSIDLTFTVPDAHLGVNDLRSAINLGILQGFRQHGVVLAQPSRMVSMVSTKDV